MPPKTSQPVKCVRDVRGIPPSAYRLPSDGRKWKKLCEDRKALFMLLATYADADGTRCFPSIEEMEASTEWSRRKVFRVLDKLAELGVIESKGLSAYHGTRNRLLHPENLPNVRSHRVHDESELVGV